MSSMRQGRQDKIPSKETTSFLFYLTLDFFSRFKSTQHLIKKNVLWLQFVQTKKNENTQYTGFYKPWPF